VSNRSLSGALADTFVTALSEVDEARARRYPGDRLTDQPVHTCYVPAGAVRPDLLQHWGSSATEALRAHAGTPADLAEIAGLPAELAESVYERLLRRLAERPVEDVRFDFEDGYGAPGDDTEDADAVRAARVLADWHRAGTVPPYAGLRVKSFDTVELRRRSVRTLDVFLTALDGLRPEGLLVTFPKVTDVRQVEVFVDLLEQLETALGLPAQTLVFEIQVETQQAIVDSSGRLALPSFIAAGRGRVRGLHFGTYDYTAGLGLPTASQHLAHGSCDFARHVMQVSAAGTGVWCSDGSTNILPVGDRDAVRHGWRTHARLVRRSLDHGFYQGWDLHPHQLVTRYATVYGFYRAGAPTVAARLVDYLGQRTGAVADEPATARMQAAFLLRALRCGALDPAELPDLFPAQLAELC